MTHTDFIKKIDDFIRKYYLNQLIRGSIWLCFVFLVSFLVVVTAEYFGYFSPDIKTILFYLFIAVQIVLLIFLVIKPLSGYLKFGKIISYEQASEIIGSHFPEVKDKLTNTLQLQEALSDHPEQKNLILAAVNQKISQMQPVPFVSAVNIRENKKYLPYVLIPIGIVFILAFAAPAILMDGTKRLIKHNQHFVKKAPFSFHILNKELIATQGDDFLLKVKLSGEKIPQELYIEDGTNSFKLKKEDILNFSYLFKNLQENKQFRFRAAEYYSEFYLLQVDKKPLLMNISAELHYPEYLKLKSQKVNNPGSISVPEGTTIRWTFTTENTNYLDFMFSDKKYTLNASAKNIFKHQTKIMQSGNYSLTPVNKNNNNETLSHQINAIPDAFPQISVEEKTDSLNFRVLYFMGKASDDHGLTKLSFHYQIKESPDKSRKGKHYKMPIKVKYGDKQSSFFFLWALSNLGITDGEEVVYYFAATDNDGVNGPKTTKSEERLYKLASKEENQEKVNESTTVVKQKIQSAIKQSKQIQQEVQKINQEILNNKNFDFEQQKQVEQLLDKQQKLENLLKEISDENKKNLLERKQLDTDKELLEKQEKIQELFNNVLDEKTKELLRNLQKMMEEKNKNLPQSEMKQMQMDNKALEKELDRILELYKKLEAEQKLNENIKKLEELAKKQLENIQESSLQKQDEINKEFEQIKDGLKEAKDKNDALDKPDNYDIKEPEQKAIDKDLKEAKTNLQQNKKQQAGKSQKDAAQKMKDLAQKLEEMQGAAEMEQQELDVKALRQILQNLLKTSFDQEELMLEMKKTETSSPKFTTLGQKQREIKDNLKIVEDSLFALSKKVPEIATTVNKEIAEINQQIAEALDNLPDRNVAQVNKNQQYALTAINNLSLMLSEALQQIQQAMKNGKSGGKGKPTPGLSELTKMQEQLNKNMQKAKEQMQQQGVKPGQKGNGSMSQQFSEMAKQQQMIRQALQELNQKLNKDGQGKLGDFEKIMKEMEQTETELVNRRITQESLLRQQEIKVRLLEAEKAEREREQDTQKESKAGKEFAPNYDIRLKEYQKVKQQEAELLKTIPAELNNFYREKTNGYLEQIKE